MKIIVCVKQVPASNEVKLNPETGTIIREGVASTINPYDTYALEAALRLKAAGGGTVTTISMGIPSVTSLLRTTLALGADAAYLLSDRNFAGADTLATAYALAVGIKHIGECDLIICGKQATDGDTAQVGPSLAEKLAIPHVTDVQAITSVDSRQITCVRLTDEGQETISLSLPALITVVKGINLPRLPSISGLRAAQAAEVVRWDAEAIEADPQRIGLQGSPTQVAATFVPEATRQSQRIDGGPQQQAAQLLNLLRSQRLLQTPPANQEGGNTDGQH